MKAVVVGGGVAGAATAIGLARVGAEVTVVEAYADPAGQVGSFLSLAANGLRGLDALGCLSQVQAAGFPVPWQRMLSGDGKVLAEVARARPVGDPLHSVTLMRSDLVAALREEAVRCGARIVTGQRVEAGDPRSAAADLVVGADGLWSDVRRLVDPQAPRPTYAGLYSVSGVSRGLDLPTGAFNMVFARRGAFIFVPAPDGSVWWQAQIAAVEPPASLTVPLDELVATFRTEPQAVAVLRATAAVHGATLHHVLAPVPLHHDGRTVVIGDAAHPVGAGQGASMAIEDAVVLATQMGRNATVPAALAAYDGLRRKRVDRMAKGAATNRDAKVAGPLAARMRNLVMPLVFPRVYPRATAWLYDFDPGALEPTGR